jgi:predicted acyl esterase
MTRCPLPWLALVATLAGCDTDSLEVEDPIIRDFATRAGVEQVTVLDARPSAELSLYSDAGDLLVTVIADEDGQAHFAYIPSEPIVFDGSQASREAIVQGRVVSPGDYTITDESGLTSGPIHVLALEDVPPPEWYDAQELDGIISSPLSGDEGDPQDGFHYIEVRDGVTLSAMIRFPDPLLYGEGPWPTVVEYSGYSPSRPTRMEPGTRIAIALGYAVVSVNMRGTGCSDGVFDVFSPAQQADGYDIIEAVSRQEWALNNQVGIIGLSYSGIAALYTATTAPPSLAAAVPMSVIGDPWEMQWPGGIYNQGFTKSWIDNRESQAAANGSSWVVEQIDSGDETCRENVSLSHLSIDFEEFLALLEYRHTLLDERDLTLLIDKVQAPIYLVGQFQDEQTGAQFGRMLDGLDNSPHSRLSLSNGRHPDGYGPDMVFRWFEFLELYVAERVPQLNPLIRAVGADEFAGEFNMTGYNFPEDRFTGMSYEDALAAYQTENPVLLQFENGAALPGQPGAPVPRFSTTLDSWPARDAAPTTWFADADGALATSAPTSAGVDVWAFDPDAGTNVFFGERGYQLLVRQWDLNWTRFAPGDFVSYLTPAFDEDVVLTGPGVAEVWVRSAQTDVHVQVTLTEVTPRGDETLIQSGWLRVGHRAATSGENGRIVRTFAEEDFEWLPAGEWVRADVEIPSVAHPLRAGSQLRMVISTPGRDHGTWEFLPPEYSGEIEFDLGRGGTHPTSLTLGILPGIDIPDGLPECNALRGQPCRPFEREENVVGAE